MEMYGRCLAFDLNAFPMNSENANNPWEFMVFRRLRLIKFDGLLKETLKAFSSKIHGFSGEQ